MSPARSPSVSFDNPASPPAMETLADQFNAARFDVRIPALENTGYLQITNARTATTDLTITPAGHVIWDYRPHDGRHTHPALLTGIILHLLQPGDARSHPGTPPPAEQNLKDTAGHALNHSGLTVSYCLLDPDRDSGGPGAYAGIAVTSPGQPGRGTASLTDDGTILWRCDAPAPDTTTPALTMTEITTAITSALTWAEHAPY